MLESAPLAVVESDEMGDRAPSASPDVHADEALQRQQRQWEQRQKRAIAVAELSMEGGEPQVTVLSRTLQSKGKRTTDNIIFNPHALGRLERSLGSSASAAGATKLTDHGCTSSAKGCWTAAR